MATSSGYLVGGLNDLDTIFVAYSSGTNPTTNYLVGGVDLSSRYQPLADEVSAPATNYYVNISGVQKDLNQIFEGISLST
jgi:hypothetical protein